MRNNIVFTVSTITFIFTGLILKKKLFLIFILTLPFQTVYLFIK